MIIINLPPTAMQRAMAVAPKGACYYYCLGPSSSSCPLRRRSSLAMVSSALRFSSLLPLKEKLPSYGYRHYGCGLDPSFSDKFPNALAFLQKPRFERLFSSASARDGPSPTLFAKKAAGGEEEEEEEEELSACPGCGIRLQGVDEAAPGYFRIPARLSKGGGMEDPLGFRNEEEEETLDDEDEDENKNEIEGEGTEENKLKLDSNWTWISTAKDEVGGGHLTAYGLEPKPRIEGKSRVSKKAFSKMEEEAMVVCARCHALRNYGRVKNEKVENLLPDFDFDRTVGARLMKASGARVIAVMVIDATDFDGSFPRRIAALLSEVEERNSGAWANNKPGNVPRLVIVVTKIDLLPSQIAPKRLEAWMRRRAKAGGAHPAALFLVSAFKGWGIETLTSAIKEMAGPRGEIWVIGAQNAGKSSLINALAKVEDCGNAPRLTEASVPGTTLGIIRMDGIFPAKAKLFDTPGILHPHQLSLRLTMDELKLVQVRKELSPRTYRLKVGDTIFVGGLVRLDLKEAPGSSIYVTVWMSSSLPCYMGKTANALEIVQKHVGEILQPPSSKERLPELGVWTRTPVEVSGESWERSSTDVAIAGLGWFGLGLNGMAKLDFWTYDGVAITVREALVLDIAPTFQKPGFSVVKGTISLGGKKAETSKTEAPESVKPKRISVNRATKVSKYGRRNEEAKPSPPPE